MDVIYKKRGAGKTVELIMSSYKTGAHILVCSNNRIRELEELSKKLDIPIAKPYTWDDFCRGKMQGIHNILIDDTEDVLKTIFRGMNVDAITLTDKE